MEPLSSYFFSKFQHPTNIPFPSTAANHLLTPLRPPRISPLNFSSVRNEERPQESETITIQPLRKVTKCTGQLSTKRSSIQGTELVETRLKPSLFTFIFNSLDRFIAEFLDPPLRPSIDPKYVLSGNFARVDELSPTESEVIQGYLPSCLDGAYIRNGPNPQFIPCGPYHLFDGDGMLHSIRISQGKATFCSRYVETYKYMVERRIGSPVFPNLFSAFNCLAASLVRCAVTAARVLTGQFNPINGIGLANTSLALFGGNLFALGESDLPYAVKVTSEGDIITLGRHDSFGKPFSTMTAHPKIDSDTGEAFAFRYSSTMPPFLTFFRISANGIKQKDVPIFSMKKASFIHDFALTKNYAIFPETQIGMNLSEIIKGRSPMGVDPNKVPRLGFIPRYAEDESEMWWIDVPGLTILHVINAWEEDDGNTIVLVAPNVSPVEHIFDNMDMIHFSLEKITVDIKAETVSRHPVSTKSLEFGVINSAYLRKKNKYVYAAIGAPMPRAAGVVKVDLTLSAETECGGCVVASRLYGTGCYGSEPFFVPREPNNPEVEEDDGYVVTYVHNENSNQSSFLVMDAKSPSLDIVAVVKLPGRVPYGFHGLFVPESDLNKL
ncbi:unnamed protein product [Fraxinus pennsylvanica]|uniref:Carotenoid cleavage dioxygenase 4 n=1 Tax=Fraxinus pennsylvanica TaxID=56036 RepID=A0AAD1YYV0_9LAMI|nr:unnamed protein product [Fraxinus pennsylvanica]